MRQRTNPAVIGGFVVGAVALIVIGVLLLGRGRFWTEQRAFVLYFEDSVEGLSVDAPVNFQGVRIGAVTDVQVQYLTRKGEFRVPVFIDIEPGRVKEVGGEDQPREEEAFLTSLIARGLRAQLQLQSLVTGQLSVQLVFIPAPPCGWSAAKGTCQRSRRSRRSWPRRPPRSRALWSGSSSCPLTSSSPTCWGPCRASIIW
jgi:phospholipid/cholesterol/gamma-HCH transport system substrate-binding protein